jgi:hypothetical protein
MFYAVCSEHAVLQLLQSRSSTYCLHLHVALLLSLHRPAGCCFRCWAALTAGGVAGKGEARQLPVAQQYLFIAVLTCRLMGCSGSSSNAAQSHAQLGCSSSALGKAACSRWLKQQGYLSATCLQQFYEWQAQHVTWDPQAGVL